MTGSELPTVYETRDLPIVSKRGDHVTAEASAASADEHSDSNITYVSVPVVQPLPLGEDLAERPAIRPASLPSRLAMGSGGAAEVALELTTDMALPVEEAGNAIRIPTVFAGSEGRPADRDPLQPDDDIEYVSIPVIQKLSGLNGGSADGSNPDGVSHAQTAQSPSSGETNNGEQQPSAVLDLGPFEQDEGGADIRALAVGLAHSPKTPVDLASAAERPAIRPASLPSRLAMGSGGAAEVALELTTDMALPVEEAGNAIRIPTVFAGSDGRPADRDPLQPDDDIEYVSIPVIQKLSGLNGGSADGSNPDGVSHAQTAQSPSSGETNNGEQQPSAVLDLGPFEQDEGLAGADQVIAYVSHPLVQIQPVAPPPENPEDDRAQERTDEGQHLALGASAGADEAFRVAAGIPLFPGSDRIGQASEVEGSIVDSMQSLTSPGSASRRADDPASFRVETTAEGPALSEPVTPALQATTEAASKAASSGVSLTAAAHLSQPSPTAINPYGRTIELSMPVRGRNAVLGDVLVRLGVDNRVAVKKEPLIALLQPAVTETFLSQLSQLPDEAGYLYLDQMGDAGISLTYDQVQVALLVDLPGTAAASRDIPLIGALKDVVGVFDRAARVSGYLNLRGALGFDSVNGGPDRSRPLFDLSGAARIGPLVVETDLSAEFGGQAGVLRRSFTRAVYDMPDSRLRISAGDVFTPGQSFLSTPDVLGIAIEREDRLFDPQRNLQSQRFEQFSLTEQSQVEVLLNGSVVRRLTLNPGNYRLTDFPFVSGGNDVEIIAVDQFGRREIANFSRFVSFNLLPTGQDEFAGAAGIQAITGQASRSYQFSRYTAYGSYRRGINDYLTLGGALVADTETVSAGVEATLGLPIGNLQLEAATTQDKIVGLGYTARALYTWTPSTQDRMLTGLAFSIEFISSGFTQVGRQAPSTNNVAIIASSSAAFQLSEESFVTLGGNYSSGRGLTADRYELSAQYSQRLGRSTNINVLAGYGTTGSAGQAGLLVQVGIARRFGPRGFGSARYTNRDDTLRLSYNNSGGRGVGATNINAGLDIGRDSVAGGAGAFYLANRAEIGVAHNSTYNFAGSEITGSRTTAQLATSFMFADGAFAIGRPVTDSFAIVRGHPTLKGSDIYLDRDNEHYIGKSGALGPAVVNELGSFTRRTIRVEVPDAPAGYDIGSGSFRVNPLYRSGYKLTVGSDYTKTIFGTLLNNGAPVALISGEARLESEADTPVLQLFTNRFGRFAISGLKAGRWIIEVNTNPPLRYVLDVADSDDNLIRAGEFEPI